MQRLKRIFRFCRIWPACLHRESPHEAVDLPRLRGTFLGFLGRKKKAEIAKPAEIPQSTRPPEFGREPERTAAKACFAPPADSVAAQSPVHHGSL